MDSKKIPILITSLMMVCIVTVFLLLTYDYPRSTSFAEFVGYFRSGSVSEQPIPCSQRLLELGTRRGSVWIPSGNCSMKYYNKRDIEECVERQHRFPNPDVWFFGASRLRHLLTRFMSLYTGKILNLHDLVSDAKWHSFPLGVKPIQLIYARRFLFPELNADFEYYFQMPPSERPGIIFLSIALHYKGCNLPNITRHFRADLERIVPVIKAIASGNTTKVVWKLQEPVQEAHSFAQKWCRTNAMIHTYNTYAMAALNHSGVYFWSSLISTFREQPSWTDGLHLGRALLVKNGHLLANIICRDIGIPWTAPKYEAMDWTFLFNTSWGNTTILTNPYHRFT